MNATQVWTIDDYRACSCKADEVGKEVDPTVWHLADMRDGRCTASMVGTSRIATVQETKLDEIVETTLEELSTSAFKQAVLRVARENKGYDAFLRQYPGFHQKALLAMMRESSPPGPARVDVNISWLSPERLAYKQAEVIEQGATDVTDVQSWKPNSISPRQEFDRLPNLPTDEGLPDIVIK